MQEIRHLLCDLALTSGYQRPPKAVNLLPCDLIKSVESDGSQKSGGLKKIIWLDAALKGGSTGNGDLQDRDK